MVCYPWMALLMRRAIACDPQVSAYLKDVNRNPDGRKFPNFRAYVLGQTGPKNE